MGSKIAYSFWGAIAALLLAIAGLAFFADRIDYTPKRIVSIQPLKNDADSIQTDFLSSEKLEILKDLEKRGLLLTPEEYTSHVLQFYSTLVAVLVGLFVAFSFLSFFIINDNSNKRFEKRTNELDKDVKRFVVERVSEVMRDSREFDVRLAALVKEGIDQNHVTKEQLNGVKNDVLKYSDDLDALFILYDELEEKFSESDNIVD